MSGTSAFSFTCFVGLAIKGAEVTVSGYARQPVSLVYCDDGETLANLTSVQWPHALASWGVIDGVLLEGALVDGQLLASVPVATPVLIDQYDIARIPAAGVLVINSGIPPAALHRPYGTLGFGTNAFGPYLTLNGISAIVERAFDQQDVHVCEPGTWAPGPFAQAA